MFGHPKACDGRPEKTVMFLTPSQNQSKAGRFVKACFVLALFLPVLLASQAARSDSTPIEVLNAGLNDAWFDPTTSGQGFFVIVFPDIKQVFLGWFTYDTERPAEGAQALFGEPGHRWVTAQGPYEGNTANLTLFVTKGGVFNAAEPAASTDPAGDGTVTLEFADCANAMVSYEITSLGLSGQIPIQRLALDNIAECEALIAAQAPACTRPAPDRSNGVDDPQIIDGATIPVFEVFDGGAGPDGIPPIENPRFTQDTGSVNLSPSELVVGVKVGNDIRAYPHRILNWHEVVNDRLNMNGPIEPATLSYCPLTGSAMLWKSFAESNNKTFGTSGFVFNSNLILYDREKGSFWSQMLEQAIAGTEIKRIPEKLQVVETSWGTWKAMYPGTRVLTEQTGFSRSYNIYPYGSFRTDQRLIFPASNLEDDRLHLKERVLGINVGSSSKVYPIRNFAPSIETINDTVGNMQVVTVGSSNLNFGAVYNRELEDCTILDFEAVQNKLPVVMRDNEGNEWDVFGTAVSGARTGKKLQKTNSYIAYWFAWTAFFPGSDIRQ